MGALTTMTNHDTRINRAAQTYTAVTTAPNSWAYDDGYLAYCDYPGCGWDAVRRGHSDAEAQRKAHAQTSGH
jgi:hypothetical protein